MALTDHPFQPGAQVAIMIRGGWRTEHAFKLGRVAKVQKSGRFVLEGSPQQYKAFAPGGFTKCWHATATGSSSTVLWIFDETTRPEIEAQNAKARLQQRYEDVRRVIDREPFSDLVTEDVVAKLEAVLAVIKPKKEAA